MNKDSETPPPGGKFLVYQTEDGKLKIDVRFEGGTVWLTQQHMAELFQTTQKNISLRLQIMFDKSFQLKVLPHDGPGFATTR